MKEQLNNYLKAKADFIIEFKKWCADKSVDVNERWDLFILSELGDRHSWILRPFEIFGQLYFDDLSYEKHEIITADGLLERFWEHKSDYEEDEGDYELSKEFKQAVAEFNEDEYKEFFLQKFVKSFKLDW